MNDLREDYGLDRLEENNEIKEILDEISEKIIPNEHWNKLKDYIINLQQENEGLKDSVDWWKDRFFGQQEYDDSHRITAIEYKKRIDKAIKYLEKAAEGLEEYHFDGYDPNLPYVISILNGDNNE